MSSGRTLPSSPLSLGATSNLAEEKESKERERKKVAQAKKKRVASELQKIQELQNQALAGFPNEEAEKEFYETLTPHQEFLVRLNSTSARVKAAETLLTGGEKTQDKSATVKHSDAQLRKKAMVASRRAIQLLWTKHQETTEHNVDLLEAVVDATNSDHLLELDEAEVEMGLQMEGLSAYDELESDLLGHQDTVCRQFMLAQTLEAKLACTHSAEMAAVVWQNQCRRKMVDPNTIQSPTKPRANPEIHTSFVEVDEMFESFRMKTEEKHEVVEISEEEEEDEKATSEGVDDSSSDNDTIAEDGVATPQLESEEIDSGAPSKQQEKELSALKSEITGLKVQMKILEAHKLESEELLPELREELEIVRSSRSKLEQKLEHQTNNNISLTKRFEEAAANGVKAEQAMQEVKDLRQAMKAAAASASEELELARAEFEEEKSGLVQEMSQLEVEMAQLAQGGANDKGATQTLKRELRNVKSKLTAETDALAASRAELRAKVKETQELRTKLEREQALRTIHENEGKQKYEALQKKLDEQTVLYESLGKLEKSALEDLRMSQAEKQMALAKERKNALLAHARVEELEKRFEAVSQNDSNTVTEKNVELLSLVQNKVAEVESRDVKILQLQNTIQEGQLEIKYLKERLDASENKIATSEDFIARQASALLQWEKVSNIQQEATLEKTIPNAAPVSKPSSPLLPASPPKETDAPDTLVEQTPEISLSPAPEEEVEVSEAVEQHSEPSPIPALEAHTESERALTPAPKVSEEAHTPQADDLPLADSPHEEPELVQELPEEEEPAPQKQEPAPQQQEPAPQQEEEETAPQQKEQEPAPQEEEEQEPAPQQEQEPAPQREEEPAPQQKEPPQEEEPTPPQGPTQQEEPSHEDEPVQEEESAPQEEEPTPQEEEPQEEQPTPQQEEPAPQEEEEHTRVEEPLQEKPTKMAQQTTELVSKQKGSRQHLPPEKLVRLPSTAEKSQKEVVSPPESFTQPEAEKPAQGGRFTYAAHMAAKLVQVTGAIRREFDSAVQKSHAVEQKIATKYSKEVINLEQKIQQKRAELEKQQSQAREEFVKLEQDAEKQLSDHLAETAAKANKLAILKKEATDALTKSQDDLKSIWARQNKQASIKQKLASKATKPEVKKQSKATKPEAQSGKKKYVFEKNYKEEMLNVEAKLLESESARDDLEQKLQEEQNEHETAQELLRIATFEMEELKAALCQAQVQVNRAQRELRNQQQNERDLNEVMLMSHTEKSVGVSDQDQRSKALVNQKLQRLHDRLVNKVQSKGIELEGVVDTWKKSRNTKEGRNSIAVFSLARTLVKMVESKCSEKEIREVLSTASIMETPPTNMTRKGKDGAERTALETSKDALDQSKVCDRLTLLYAELDRSGVPREQVAQAARYLQQLYLGDSRDSSREQHEEDEAPDPDFQLVAQVYACGIRARAVMQHTLDRFGEVHEASEKILREAVLLHHREAILKGIAIKGAAAAPAGAPAKPARKKKIDTSQQAHMSLHSATAVYFEDMEVEPVAPRAIAPPKEPPKPPNVMKEEPRSPHTQSSPPSGKPGVFFTKTAQEVASVGVRAGECPPHLKRAMRQGASEARLPKPGMQMPQHIGERKSSTRGAFSPMVKIPAPPDQRNLDAPLLGQMRSPRVTSHLSLQVRDSLAHYGIR